MELRFGTDSGLEFIEYVRNTPEFSSLPIVVLHGGANPKTVEAARRLGIKTFVSKPSHLTELETVLQTLAQRNVLITNFPRE
jgi:DNA-binding NarL/FixJ family response regulator